MTVALLLRNYRPIDLFLEWPSSMYFDINPGQFLAFILFNDVFCRKPESLILIMTNESEHTTMFLCLFSWRYNQLWLYFHSLVAGFSLLVFEVS
jgi:hypothetical protein